MSTHRPRTVFEEQVETYMSELKDKTRKPNIQSFIKHKAYYNKNAGTRKLQFLKHPFHTELKKGQPISQIPIQEFQLIWFLHGSQQSTHL